MMKPFDKFSHAPHVRFLSIGKYIGHDPASYNAAAKNAQQIQQVKARTPTENTASLTNQTGGNTIGFTYE